jgi:hypothetical protein
LNGTNGLPGDNGSKGDKGDTGAQGISVTLQGTLALIADLDNVINPQPGDAWIVTESNGGDLYFRTPAGAWDNIGKIVGPKGDKGDSGDKGDRGFTGDNGQNGLDGRSAYELAVDGGFIGTQAEWLTSLIGQTGSNGADGLDGVDGRDGRDAYELAVLGGFSGTQAEWLQTLVGQSGTNGTNGLDGSTWLVSTGLAPYPGTNPGDQYLDSSTGNIYSWDSTSWNYAGNIKGLPGDAGSNGSPGQDALWFWQGNYSDSPQYQEGDIVAFEGATYRRNNIGNSVIGVHPTDTAYWEVIAERGVDGAPGQQGEPGISADQSLNTTDNVQFNGLTLTNGDDRSGSNGWNQIVFGYDGSLYQPHYIRTRHDDSIPDNNAIDFYTNANQSGGDVPPILGLSVANGVVIVRSEIKPQEGNDLNLTSWNPTVEGQPGGVTISLQNRDVDSGGRNTQLDIAPTNITLTTDFDNNQYQWVFGTDGTLTLPNSAVISSTTIGFGLQFPTNGDGQYSVNAGSLTVGIPNPDFAAAILANPGNYTANLDDRNGYYPITGISGPRPGTNVYTITGDWYAGSGAFPVFISSNDYAEGVTTLSSISGAQIATAGGAFVFDVNGILTVPSGGDILRNGVSAFASGGGTIWTDPANGCLRAELSSTGFQAFTAGTHLDLQDGGQWNIGSYQNSTSIGNDEFDNLHDLSLRSGDATYITTNLRENGNFKWTFGTDGTLTLAGDAVASNGRFVQDCANDTTSFRWVNVNPTRGDQELGRVYLDGGSPYDNTEQNERVQFGYADVDQDVSSFYISTTKNPLGLFTSDADDKRWNFLGTGGFQYPDGTQQYTAWQGAAIISATAPSLTETKGRLWFNTTDARMYMLYNNQWVDASPTVVAPKSTYTGSLEIEDNTITNTNLSDESVTIVPGVKSWRFTDNSVTFPDGTRQETAFTQQPILEIDGGDASSWLAA